MRNFKPLVFLFPLALMLSGCGNSKVDIISADGAKTVSLRVEIADNPAERARGLMERTELKPDTGMLFVFEEPEILSFWMKNTVIPLEIIFFDQEGLFVNSAVMQPCINDPCPRYASQALTMYAIEAPPGFREKNGIGVGSKLDLEGVRKIARPI